MLARVLKMGGHTVTAVHSGGEALAQLETQPFDVLITDLGLPGMSGWEVADAAYSRWPQMPVVLITGWGDRIGPDELARYHIAAVLTKPFEIQTLLTTVSQLLNR